MNDFLPRFGGLRSLTKPISSKRYALFFVKAEKKGKEIGGIPPAEVGNFLHILYGGSKQALFVQPQNGSAIRYEAENAKLTGSAYKSTAQVAGIDDVGSSLTFDHQLIEEDGDYTLRIEKTQTDTGFAELDAFDLLPCSLTGGVPVPSPAENDV